MDLPSDEDVDLACRHAAARISARLAEHGIEDGASGIGVDPGMNGTVLLHRARTTANGLVTGPTYLSLTGDPTHPLDGRSIEALDLEIDRHVRRKLRLQSLAKAGIRHEEEHPAWSYTIQRLALGWLRALDIDPALLTGGPKSDACRAVSILADQKGVSIGGLRIEDGRLDLSAISDSGGVQLIGHGRPALLVETEVPETLATSMQGRLVSEIIDHPATRRSGPVRIKEVDNREGLLTLVLDDVQDFIRRPPVGIDRRWRTIPYRPTPSDS